MKRTLKNITLIALVIISSVAVGQKKHLDNGDEFFNKRMYKEAIEEYKIALDEKMVFSKYKMTKRIAQTYKMLFDYEAASEWYGKTAKFTDEAEPKFIFEYAQLLCNLEKYEIAKTQFKRYYETIEQPDNYKHYEEICDWAIQNKDVVGGVIVSKTNLETGGRSMGVSFYKEGVVYAQPQSNDYITKTVYSDLAYAKRNDTATFDSPSILSGDLNNSFYEGSPSFSTDEKRMFYTGNATETVKYRDRKVKRKNIPLSKEGLNILHIYESKNVNGKWTKGESIAINGNDFDCVFPYLTKDEKRLYFASNMLNGFGGFDLYYSDLIGDTIWGKPINLGKQINTELDEMYPYIDSDTLYFSSKGKKGFGGSDIYKSVINGTAYGEPINMGKPYNSSKDDFSFIIKNKDRTGYFSSNRHGTHGYDNIYEFNIPEELDTIRGLAINKITEEPIGDLIVKLNAFGAEELPKLISEFTTNTNGKVTLVLKKHIEYLVTIYHPEFDGQTFKIPAENRADVIAEFGKLVFMPTPKKDKIVKIDNIYYDFNKSTIKEASYPVLDRIVEYLNVNSTLKVELSAHSDSRGGDRYNLNLSSKRAKSVVTYLVGKGIEKSRLTPKGYGEQKLVNKCANGVECSEEQHQQNRRVELKNL